MRIKILILGLACLFLMNCAVLIDEVRITNRRQEYVKLNSWISPEIKEVILNGDIIIGMTPQQVIASRGKPKKINRTTGEWGVHEQWVYASVYGPKLSLSKKERITTRKYGYIYFEDGKVTSWQSY